MYERGTITKVDNNIITVRCSTHQCRGCSASKVFCKKKDKEFQSLNPDNLDLEIGDVVEIYISPGKTIWFSFSVLIFPLILFPIGYYLTGLIANTTSDGIRLIGGLASLVIGFLTAFVYNSYTKDQKYPVILKKLEERAKAKSE
ncbi:MAG: SoxR reducing system RseC family protein [Spirochaetes bacterium]|nr:SoxR reducing system RseC family protein [Spirochaetota bacterium]